MDTKSPFRLFICFHCFTYLFCYPVHPFIACLLNYLRRVSLVRLRRGVTGRNTYRHVDLLSLDHSILIKWKKKCLLGIWFSELVIQWLMLKTEMKTVLQLMFSTRIIAEKSCKGLSLMEGFSWQCQFLSTCPVFLILFCPELHWYSLPCEPD